MVIATASEGHAAVQLWTRNLTWESWVLEEDSDALDDPVNGVGYYAVAFSPDSQWLAVGAGGFSSNIVTLWSIVTHQRVRVLTGHQDLVSAVAFCPKGRYLASASDDHSVRIWDLQRGAEQKVLEHKHQVQQVTFSPDGKYLVCPSLDTKGSPVAAIWDTASWTIIALLMGHKEWINSVAFVPDGSTLVTGSDDHTIRFWDMTKHEELFTLQGFERGIKAVVFSPDGKKMITGEDSATIRLWDYSGF
jgi:WD40 repeat protein